MQTTWLFIAPAINIAHEMAFETVFDGEDADIYWDSLKEMKSDYDHVVCLTPKTIGGQIQKIDRLWIHAQCAGLMSGYTHDVLHYGLNLSRKYRVHYSEGDWVVVEMRDSLED